MFSRIVLRSATVAAILASLLVIHSAAQTGSRSEIQDEWRFAVSGDSRNCGDVVMPAIAASVLQHQVDFYWHLGDLRFMGWNDSNNPYNNSVDEDMCQEYNGKFCGKNPSDGDLTPDQYHNIAWTDFIAHQVAPFGTLPVFIGIGNHETYKYGYTDAQERMSHKDFTIQFAHWLNRPEIKSRRLDGPALPADIAYYEWKHAPVDFIYLDNSLETGFDAEQLQWLRRVLDRARSDDEVKTVVVGMHRALPNSLACGHSMNGDAPVAGETPEAIKARKVREALNATSLASGLEAYHDLVQFKKETGKLVYLLASHSHFFMENIFDTVYWQDPKSDGEVLPGWIIGTAGARRYILPGQLDSRILAKTYAYGYLLARVKKNGVIDFKFEELTREDVPKETEESFGDGFLDFCFYANRDTTLHPPPDSCKEAVSPMSKAK